MSVLIVLTNLPSREEAVNMAQILVDARAAACVNVLTPCLSIYHWQGKTESTEEFPLLIKTTMEQYPVVEKLICTHHPYELPEIIQVPVTGGLTAYLEWIDKETS